jgi:hypothetical protein
MDMWESQASNRWVCSSDSVKWENSRNDVRVSTLYSTDSRWQYWQRRDISKCAKLSHLIEMMIFGFGNPEILVRLIAEVRINI